MIVKVFNGYTEITLPSGKVVSGVPTKDQVPIARELGYGDDIVAMCMEHDPMHVHLCEMLKIPVSYSLSKAAGEPLSEKCQILAGLEEDAVLAVLKFKKAHENRNASST